MSDAEALQAPQALKICAGQRLLFLQGAYRLQHATLATAARKGFRQKHKHNSKRWHPMGPPNSAGLNSTFDLPTLYLTGLTVPNPEIRTASSIWFAKLRESKLNALINLISYKPVAA